MIITNLALKNNLAYYLIIDLTRGRVFLSPMNVTQLFQESPPLWETVNGNDIIVDSTLHSVEVNRVAGVVISNPEGAAIIIKSAGLLISDPTYDVTTDTISYLISRL